MLGSSTDISVWAAGNTLGFGASGSGIYGVSPFGSKGSAEGLIARINRANGTRASRLGRRSAGGVPAIYDPDYVASLGGPNAIAIYDDRVGDGSVFVGDAVRGPYADARSVLWHEYSHAGASRAGFWNYPDSIDDQLDVGPLQFQGLSGRTYPTDAWEAAYEYPAYSDQLSQNWGYIPGAITREYRHDARQYESLLRGINPGFPAELQRRFGNPPLPIP